LSIPSSSSAPNADGHHAGERSTVSMREQSTAADVRYSL
jgi:hypothetical protein